MDTIHHLIVSLVSYMSYSSLKPQLSPFPLTNYLAAMYENFAKLHRMDAYDSLLTRSISLSEVIINLLGE